MIVKNENLNYAMKRKALFVIACLSFFFFCIALFLPSVKAKAAVKTMPDGRLFDPSFYAATYDDVYKAFGMNEALLYQHYILCGIKEKRLPYAGYEYDTTDPMLNSPYSELMIMPDGLLFDPVYYAKQYPDVAKVYGNLPSNLYLHYLLFGMNEGRKPYDGYKADDVKLIFTTVGAIADVANQGELIEAIRQAGKYRITNLTIRSKWDGKLSAEAMTSVANNQIAYMKTYYGVKKMTYTKPVLYGDSTNPTLQMEMKLAF